MQLPPSTIERIAGLEELIQKTKLLITKWQKEENLQMEVRCISSILTNHLTLSLLKFNNPREASSYLKSETASNLLSRKIQLAHKLKTKSTESQHTIMCREEVHIAWLIDAPELANQIIQELRSAENLSATGTSKIHRFWIEYDRSLEALSTDTPFTPNFDKLSGLQLHWSIYSKLIEDITKKKDATITINIAHDCFKKRQSDSRLFWSMLDGHPAQPVKWDFRAASILMAARMTHLLPQTAA